MKHAANTPPPLSVWHLRIKLVRACLAAACMLGMGLTAALADSYSDVNQLLKDGQAAQALAKADAYIEKNPRDPQMRFLRGVILSEQGKQAEAAEVFTQLTRDYPELPEPFNNLAAIFAAQGEYGKAREALETALRLNPDYVTAHENLGDIYARLAAQQYARAAQFASASKAVQPKLDHVRQLFDGGVAKAPGTASAPVAPKAETTSTSAPAPKR